MSSQVRLLLCSGSDREGASALADLVEEQTTWLRIAWCTDESDDDGALLDIFAAADYSFSPLTFSSKTTAISGTSLARSLARAIRLGAALVEGGVLDGKSVVLDCGEATAFASDLNDLHAMHRLATEVLRPELLMDDSGRAAHARVSHVIEVLDALFLSLSQRAVMRCAVRPGSWMKKDVGCVVLDLALLGIAVDGVAIAPAKKPIGVAERDEFARELADLSSLARVWRSGSLRAAPKGHRVDEFFVKDRGVSGVREAAGGSPGEYIGTCDARGVNSAELRVGVDGEYLVIASPRVRRWLPLPSTLVRCSPISAGVDEFGIHAHFVANPSLWPESAFSAVADPKENDRE